jgi:hypothetical protein
MKTQEKLQSGSGFDRIGLWMTYSQRPGDSPDSVRVHLLKPPGPHVIGSGSKADIVVPDRFLSRTHFRLEWAEGRIVLHDLASTNGTRVDGRTIRGRLELPLPAVVHAGLREYALFEAVETRNGPAVSFGRLVGTDPDMAALFHNLMTGVEGDYGGTCPSCLRILGLAGRSWGDVPHPATRYRSLRAGPQPLPRGGGEQARKVAPLRLLPSSELAFRGADPDGELAGIEVFPQRDQVFP